MLNRELFVLWTAKFNIAIHPTFSGDVPCCPIRKISPVISDSMNSAGVYVIVFDDGTRYVGKSANVNRRIFQHLTKIKMVGLCVLWKSAMKEKDTLILRISSLPKVRIGRRSGK